MISIIRLHYPNHECDDELLALEVPGFHDPEYALIKAHKILEAPVSAEEENMDFLDVLDERIKQFMSDTGYALRVINSDEEISAGF